MKMQIKTLPQIFIITLKRFYFNNGCLEKIKEVINYPIKSFKLNARWMSEENVENNDVEYELYAVSNHIGTTNGGIFSFFI